MTAYHKIFRFLVQKWQKLLNPDSGCRLAVHNTHNIKIEIARLKRNINNVRDAIQVLDNYNNRSE